MFLMKKAPANNGVQSGFVTPRTIASNRWRINYYVILI